MIRCRAGARLAFALCCLLPALAIGLILLDSPEFLVDSDTLLPAAFSWDVLHHAYAWHGFEQARVPSFIPDLLLYGALQAATGSWRAATAIWVCLMLAALLALGGAIVARLARTDLRAGLAAFAAAAIVVLAATIAGMPAYALAALRWTTFPFLIVLVPVTHGGPFILGLGAALLGAAETVRTRPARLAVLALAIAALVLSDLLAVIGLVAPLTAALLAGVLTGRLDRPRALRLAAVAWAATALGFAAMQMLYRQGLPMPRGPDLPAHVGAFLTDLVRHPVLTAVIVALAAVLAIELRARGWRGVLGTYWLTFGATAALASLATAPLLYEDTGAYRYCLPLLWWTVILWAARLARVRLWRSAAPVVAASLALLLAYARAGPHPPAIFAWRSALATCLEDAALHAGLAGYWTARSTSAATDWALQVEQLTRAGQAYVWGNDPVWFVRDIHDGTRLPDFSFIVIDQLDPARIAAVYGQPDGVLRCGGKTVWTYRDPARLIAALLAASPDLAPALARTFPPARPPSR